MTSALAPAPAKPAPLIAASLARLEKDLGGRDRLVAALAHAPKDPALTYLVGLLADPLRRKQSLADLCATGGITAGELLDAYKRGQTNLAQALSLKGLDHELPKVVEDTFRMALPREQVCVICEGVGTLVAERTRRNPNPEPETCKACRGTGHQDIEGDIEHKKLVLELGQLTSKPGGISIAMQQNVAAFGSSSGGALEQLQQATDQILYGSAAPLAVEVSVDAAVESTEGEIVDTAEEPDWRGDSA